jgi:hypothetical protein
MAYLLVATLLLLIGYWVASRSYRWRQEQLMKHYRLATNGYIYFVQQRIGGRRVVKIGRSIDPIKRIKTLSTSAPYGLHILGIMPTFDDVASEKMIHQQFAYLRISKKNEWFALNPTLWAYINAVSDPVLTASVRSAVNGRLQRRTP